MRNDWKRRTFMTVTLNQRAYERAKELIDEGRFVFDERDAWSEHQPSAMEESEYIRLHGFAEHGKWCLGVNSEKPENTKGTISFPMGISRMSTAVAYSLGKAVPAKYQHYDIENAAAHLME
jgi:hypothetical protein